MSDNESVHYTELPKIIDDGTNNNYGEWKIRSYHKLREWGLLKYIEGPTSDPPFIPPLRQTLTCQSVDDNGNLSTTHVLGNDAEHQKALADAEPWLSGNDVALSRIVTALPSRQLYLVQNVLYAKQAWESLRSVYRPRNLLHAATTKHQIMTYRCTSDMDVPKWLNDMQRLYSCPCHLDIECMSDREFALAILDLMPQDDGWRYFVSDLRKKVHDCDTQGVPISSITFIAAIRDEYWYRHKDDFNTTRHVFSARYEAQERSTNASKRPRPTDLVTPSTSPVVAAKRARGPNPSKADLRCSNPYCGPKTGHDTADCVAYKGAKEGQYGDWWRGPWNIHLPESQRTKENNVPPKTHPAHARWYNLGQSYPTRRQFSRSVNHRPHPRSTSNRSTTRLRQPLL